LEPVQLNDGLVDIPVAPFAGEGLDGVPSVAHAVAKLHTAPVEEPPQLFLATIFQ
jgi:hypothetical protein